MELVKLKPAVKDYIWGGNYFQKYGKGIGLERVSECWELSTRDSDSSIIASGKDQGKLLCDVITKEDIGPVMEKYPYFPLLIKLIDAKTNLSGFLPPAPLTVIFLPTTADGLAKLLMSIGRESQSKRFFNRPG